MTAATGDGAAVWDCFIFYNELALLEYRLRLLDPVVDHFVVIEATRTHAGAPKPMHFAANAARFARHAAKIRHVVVDDMPLEGASAWDRERFQRRAVWRGLDGVRPADLVLVGDLDEVPDPAVVTELAETLDRPTRLGMRHFAFAANFELPRDWTDGTMAARGDQLDASQMAVLMGDPEAPWSAGNDCIRRGAGYHLSFLGGRDAVAGKLQDYAHREMAIPAFSRPRHVERCVALGVHVAGEYAIRRRSREELPQAVGLLAEMSPDLFDFRPGPSPAKVRLYLAYARHGKALPPRLLAAIDRRPAPFAVAFGPFLVALDALLRFAAAHRLRHRVRQALARAPWAARGAAGVLLRQRLPRG